MLVGMTNDFFAPVDSVSKTDRDRAEQRLREAHQLGRIDAAELEARMSRVIAAERLDELAAATDGPLPSGATNAYAESRQRVRNMTKAQWNAVKDQGDEATRLLAELMDRDPADPEVQTAIAKHHAWIENFYTASAEMYAGLGQMYADDPRFRANYDKYAPDLADFMRDALAVYAKTVLARR